MSQSIVEHPEVSVLVLLLLLLLLLMKMCVWAARALARPTKQGSTERIAYPQICIKCVPRTARTHAV